MEQLNKLPIWMNDPEIQKIPKEKLELLKSVFETSKGMEKKQLMSYLMPLMQKAKKEGLTFTTEEMNTMINTMKKYSTMEELNKINKILEKTKDGIK